MVKGMRVFLLFLLCSPAFALDYNVLMTFIANGIKSGGFILFLEHVTFIEEDITPARIREGVTWVQTVLSTAKSDEIPSTDVIQGEIERLLAMASKGTTQYPLVIHADNLKDVKQGWDIKVAKGTTVSDVIQEFQNFRGQLVCPVGDYDTGKTFLINSIESSQLPSGFGNVTSAFSFFKSGINQNVVYLDTAGQKRTVASDGLNNKVSMEDRKATDEFIIDFVSYACDAIFYLVGPLERPDVHEIDSMYHTRRLRYAGGDFIVIHNYFNMFRVEDVERHILSDIVAAFDAVPDASGLYWRSHDGKMIHLVMGREGAPSGKLYNNQTVDLIRTKIKAYLTKPDQRDIISKMTEISEGILPNYFWYPNMNVENIPFVFSTNTIIQEEMGARMELPTMEQQENDLKSLVSKTAEKVRYYACAFFGSDWCASHKTQPADNDVKVEKVELERKNPFKVMFDNAAAKLRLQDNTVELKYLPFTNNMHKFSWTPDYDLYRVRTKGKFEWTLVVDVPGVSKDSLSIYCPIGEGGWADNTKIRLTGIRTPPSYTNTEREDTPFPRQYGSFDMQINLPGVLSCSLLKERGFSLDKGVLYLSSSENLLEARFGLGNKKDDQKSTKEEL